MIWLRVVLTRGAEKQIWYLFSGDGEWESSDTSLPLHVSLQRRLRPQPNTCQRLPPATLVRTGHLSIQAGEPKAVGHKAIYRGPFS